ncbi:hypothetical protein [Motiliproteus sp. SC1-56]|uniref:hypothetical protein n=1 Tax=Motiliproteus sp. SC1-56 TaxID=2799565 RepID=UPI001A8E3440|nr:hypothetical protein [Motiliproteus sp. SC1-56]
MYQRDFSDVMIEADFLWREIAVGDQILVEDAIIEAGVELLSPGREYVVVEKQCSDTGVQSFLVESNIPRHSARLYPHWICSYSALPRELLS